MASKKFCHLPVDVILIIMDYLDPHSLLFLMQAVPYLIPFLTSLHLKVQDENGDTILHLIVDQGIEDMIKPLMRIIPGNSIANNDKLTPLHQAVIKGNQTMTRLLLAAGSNISTQGPDGETVLHYVCQHKHPSVLDNDGTYEQKSLAILRMLIDSGADLNARTNNPRRLTPLFRAVWTGKESALRILLDAGADPQLPCWYGQTTLTRATSKNHTGIMRLLLDAGMDASGRGQRGTTPLIMAAVYDAGEAFDLLFKAGADPSMVCDCGSSALHWTARRVNERLVRLLLEAGVDVSVRDMFGRTPLDLAVIGGKETKKDIKEVVRMLKEAEDGSRNLGGDSGSYHNPL
jgi:ankyrin repeat protein